MAPQSGQCAAAGYRGRQPVVGPWHALVQVRRGLPRLRRSSDRKSIRSRPASAMTRASFGYGGHSAGIANNPRKSLVFLMPLSTRMTLEGHARLTLTYGLRWDVNLAPAARYPGWWRFRISACRKAFRWRRKGHRLGETTWANFRTARRRAYQVSQRKGMSCVARGFGVFYDRAISSRNTGGGGRLPIPAPELVQ